MSLQRSAGDRGCRNADQQSIQDQVHESGQPVLITKHGKPVAKLVPADKEKDDIYDFLAGKGTITGNVVAPAISRDDWGELK